MGTSSSVSVVQMFWLCSRLIDNAAVVVHRMEWPYPCGTGTVQLHAQPHTVAMCSVAPVVELLL